MGSAPKTAQDAHLEVLGKQKEDVNFKKNVICSKHWSCDWRLNLEDFPSIKFIESRSQESPKVSQEHWHCADTPSASIPGTLKTRTWIGCVYKVLANIVNIYCTHVVSPHLCERCNEIEVKGSVSWCKCSTFIFHIGPLNKFSLAVNSDELDITCSATYLL